MKILNKYYLFYIYQILKNKFNYNFFILLFIYIFKYIILFYLNFINYVLHGDRGLGIGDWGLGPIPNPQSPIPNKINFN